MKKLFILKQALIKNMCIHTAHKSNCTYKTTTKGQARLSSKWKITTGENVLSRELEVSSGNSSKRHTVGVASSAFSARHRPPGQIQAQMPPLSRPGLVPVAGQLWSGRSLLLPSVQEPRLLTRPQTATWAEGRGVSLWECLEGRKQFIRLDPVQI